MRDKEVKCPWCGVIGVPIFKMNKKSGGDIAERICSSCNQILAAYLSTEGNFLPKIRVFENKYDDGGKDS